MKNLLMAFVLMPMVAAAMAYTETVDGVTWSYTIISGKVEVGSEGTAISRTTAGAIKVPSILGGKPVTYIGNYAFSGCDRITTVIIPDGVKSIGAYAFSGCSCVTTVTVPSSVTSIGDSAFYNCSALTSITIPDGVMRIGRWAFYGCKGLTSVVMPEGVTSIGGLAFSNCSSLMSVSLPSSVTNIEGHAFDNCERLRSFVVDSENIAFSSVRGLLCSKDGKILVVGVSGEVTIPESVTSIGSSAFYGCSGLVTVMIPSNVTSIGASAFYGCSGLTSVTIPGSVTSIGNSAFYGCSGMTSVTLLTEAASIGDSVFRDCSGLTSVTIPEGVKSIGKCAFKGCSKLSDINLPATLVEVGEEAFAETLFWSEHATGVVEKDGCALGWKGSVGSHISLPSGVRVIADASFKNCDELSSVVIPNGVVTIGNSAFWGCDSLSEVKVPSSVRKIGDSAFRSCSALKLFAIPDGVKVIGNHAFDHCKMYDLQAIPSSVESIGYDAFYGTAFWERQTGNIVVLDECFLGVKKWYWDNTLNIPDGVRLVAGCNFGIQGNEWPKGIVIPETVKTICDYAFLNYWFITSITIPDSVTNIGYAVFAECHNLKYVSVPWGLRNRMNEAVAESKAETTQQTYSTLNVKVTGRLPAPLIEPGDGAVVDVGQEIVITNPIPESTIYYTVDGSCPTTKSDVFQKYFVTKKEMIRAIAECEGVVSPVATATLALGKVSTPTIVSSGGIEFCHSGNKVSIDCETEGAQIRYTLDGSDPRVYGRAYGEPFLVDGSITVCAFADGRVDWFDSEVVTQRLTRVWVKTESPVCSLEDGSVFYESNKKVVITANEGATIYYTLDGTDPSESSAQYEAPIAIDDTTTIKMFAIQDDYLDSEVVTVHLVRDWNICCRYDAAAHTIDTDGIERVAARSGVEVRYSSSKDGPWSEAAPAFSEIGTWNVYCQADDEVKEYSVVVEPRNLTLTSESDTKYFDGKPLTRKSLLVGGDGFVNNENVLVDFSGSQTDVGRSDNVFAYQFLNDEIASHYNVTVRFGVLTVLPLKKIAEMGEPGDGTIKDGAVSKYDGEESVYDGSGHTIDVEALHLIVLAESTPSFSYSLTSNGVYQSEPYYFTNACVTSFWYKISAANYDDYVHEARVTILPREVTLTSGSASKNFDGTALRCERVEVTGDGFVTGEGVDVVYTGSQLWPGSGENTFTYSFKQGTLASNYDVTTANGTLTVGAAGRVVVDARVTAIPVEEFKNYTELTEVVLPDTVTEIGADAFAGCTKLAKVRFPSGMEVTREKLRGWGLSDAVLDDYVEGDFVIVNTSLLGYVGAADVAELEIPEGIELIDEYALAELYDLERVELPETVKTIGKGAFANDTYLDEVVLPDSVEVIGEGAFENCSWMQTMTMGAGVRSVGDRAFAGCTKLAAAKFVEGLGEVGDAAFSNCWRMMSVSLPVSVSNVAATAFKDCASLTGMTVPTMIAPMSEWFAPVYRQIENVTVPEGTTEVCAEMFAGCAALKTVELPEGVTNIASGAFRDCAALETILLPESLEAIGDEAFAGCAALKAIVLPKNVAVLGKRVFSGCAALSDVTLSRALTAIPDGTFAGCDALDSFVVPESVTELGSQIVPSATTAIYYLGNAPAYAADVYALANAALVSYVVDGTKGWDGRPTSRDIPQTWPTSNARTIRTWSPPPPSVTVRFNATGGTVEPEERVYVSEAPFGELPVPVRTHYDFAGWFTEASGGTQVTAASEVPLADRELFAHWTAKQYAIRFHANDGTERTTEQAFIYGATVTLAKNGFVREGYTFAGWAAAEDGGSTVYADGAVWKNVTAIQDGVIHLYAVWTANDYEVRFDANGGEGTMEPQEFVYDEELALRANAFTRTGYAFAGWNVSAPRSEGAAGTVYADGATVKNLTVEADGVVTLYAQWQSVVPPVPTCGPWGEAEAVKNPDKLGPTMLTDMTLKLNGAAGAVGDVVAAFRGDTGTLCGLGKVMDGSGTLSMACYAPTGVKLHFKVWVATSGVVEPVILDCDRKSDLTAPTSGAFLSGHALVVSDDKDLTISLGSADWHTVSFNVLPEDPSPAAVFGSVKAKVAAVTQGVEFWMPGKSSSLKAIEIGKGYWVNTKVDDVEWTVSGKTDPKTEIALEEGWNLVGYAPETEGEVQAVLKTALAAKAVDYVTYGVEFYPGGTLKKMEPGKAYWVHAKKAYTLVYDEVGTQVKAARVLSAPRGEDAAGTALEPTYGPWGESEAVKNPDKLGPTFLTDMAVEIDGEPAVEGDVVAVFRGDSGTLCGLGKVMDDSGALTVVCYAPKGVTLSFKVWLAESGMDEPVIVKCDKASKLVAPESGAFYDGHAISASTEESAETIVTGEKVTIETEFVGYKAVGLPSGLKYDAKTGKITGAAKAATAAEGVVVKFTKKGAEDEEMTIVVRAEEISAGCEGLSSGPLPAGVAGAAGGMDIQIDSEGGTKSVSVTKLPSGMKYDKKSGKITGAPTKAGDYEVVLTVTTAFGNKETVKIPVKVAAMPVMAVGTFTGFISVGEDNFGAFTLTTTDAGKLTAKVVTAAGAVSFSGTCWDAVEKGVYRATLTTKKGEKLTLTLDSTAAWDVNQLSGEFTTAAIAETKKTAAVPSRTYSVSAQRNAFGKTWYFAATGDETAGWKFAYTEDTKGAALTVTLKADGSTSIAGKLPNGTDAKGKSVTIKVSASGYANVGGLNDGAILADFAPVLTVNKVKTVLTIKANLWFDRSNDHAEGVGEARFVK